MAALPAPTFEGILKSLKDGDFAPVYVLHGEETYRIDKLAAAFEEILSEDEKIFDQYILYAPDSEPQQVIGICKGVPAISPRQVVILREAQSARPDWLDKLARYVADPVPTTVLVICFRGSAIKGKEFAAAVKKSNTVVFESKGIKEYQVGPFISKIITDKGLSSEPKAIAMLIEHLGTDLSRIYSEVEKLATALPPGAKVTPEAVERHIGVSREYNSWELTDALAVKNAVKAFRIVDYLRSNPKSTPIVMVIAAVFNFFADLLTAYYVPGATDDGIMKALKLKNTNQLSRIRQGMSSYNAVQVVEIIGAIRRFAAESKGVESRQNEHLLFRDLIYHILTAPGRI